MALLRMAESASYESLPQRACRRKRQCQREGDACLPRVEPLKQSGSTQTQASALEHQEGLQVRGADQEGQGAQQQQQCEQPPAYRSSAVGSDCFECELCSEQTVLYVCVAGHAPYAPHVPLCWCLCCADLDHTADIQIHACDCYTLPLLSETIANSSADLDWGQLPGSWQGAAAWRTPLRMQLWQCTTT